jgi:hypothetical protein
MAVIVVRTKECKTLEVVSWQKKGRRGEVVL